MVASHSVYHYVLLRHLLLVLGRMVRQGKPRTKQPLCCAGTLAGSGHVPALLATTFGVLLSLAKLVVAQQG